VQVLGHPTSGKSTLIQQFRQLQNESGPAQHRSHEHLGSSGSTGSKLSVATAHGSANGSASALTSGRDDSVDTVNLHLNESTLDLLHNRRPEDVPSSQNGRRRSSGSSAHLFDPTLQVKSVHESDANNPFCAYSADLYMVVYAVNDR
jgi:hypothetical protein